MAGGAAVGRGRCGIVDALNRDWEGLVAAYRGRLSRWAAYDALRAHECLDEVLAATRLQPDATLGALLSAVAGGDSLAARVVLQSMVGRMVKMAARDRSAGVDDYLHELWLQILHYPLGRRPRRIAANLSMDTLKAICRSRRWLVQGEVSPWPPDIFGDDRLERQGGVLERVGMPAAPRVTGRRVLELGLELRLIDEATRALLHSVYVDGLSGQEAALVHRSTAGSVRVRCSRAIHDLAAHAPDLLAAA